MDRPKGLQPEIIGSSDIRKSLYFSSHIPSGGGLVLHTPDGRAWRLTAAAGEDLIDNLEINAKAAREMGSIMQKHYGGPVDPLRPATWQHLVIPYDELTQAQKDQAFAHHAATGGDLAFLTTGEVICT